MKKIILICMLVSCIVLASLPTITFAATNVATFDELSTALASGGGTSSAPKIIAVTADITITSKIVVGAGYYTLISDNYDHTITRNDNTVVNMFEVTTTSSGLNIGEATPSTTGKLTFDSNTTASSQVAAGSIIYSSKILNIYSGTFKSMNGTGVSSAIVSIAGSTLANVNNATFINNVGGDKGAAINYAGSNAVSISGCTFTSNTAATDGGAIYSTGALTLDGGTTFTTCSASRGGAIASNKRIDLKNVTIDTCSSTIATGNYGGGAILGNSGCSIFIYDGATIKNCTAVRNGGAMCDGNNALPVTMTGGLIQNCTSAASGGVYSTGYGSPTVSTFTMTGGTISGCSAVNGGVFSSSSTVNVSGGLITGCSASQFGGVTSGSGAFTLSGGTISNCTATSGGGVVGNTNGPIKFEITGTGLIDSCKATGTTANGGAFYSSNNTTTNYFKMTGGRIANCEATSNGGAVNAANVNTVLISDGIIENCKATNGGALSLTITTATISGGIIRNCTATGIGGAITQSEQNTSAGTITITGGEISGCSASNGAAIGTTNPIPTTNFCININGGAINNCIPTTSGNYVIYWLGKVLSLNGGTMSGCAERTIYVNYVDSAQYKVGTTLTTFYGGLNLGANYTLSSPHRIVFNTGKFATLSADMINSFVATIEGTNGQTVLSGDAMVANAGKFEGYVDGTTCGINSSGAIDTSIPSPIGGVPSITEITGITGSASDGYTVDFTLVDGIDPTSCVIIALYNSNGDLVGVNDSLTTADTTVNISTIGTAVKAKLMVWDNLTSIKPLIDVVPFDIQ